MNKNILEHGKILTNATKIISLLIVIIVNIIYFLKKDMILPLEQQKSLLFACVFIVAVFLPIDFSIIVKNFFKR